MKHYTPMNLLNLYKKHVPMYQSYYDKYLTVPVDQQHPNWMWDNHDYARIPCLLDFKEWTLELKLESPKKLLYTAPEDPELLYLNPKEKLLVEYDTNTHSNDLHTLKLASKDFDFVLISQTLEHLYNPELALTNIKSHMAPGGHIFLSVPMVNIPHMTPIHFRSYTQIGLITLLDSLGFEILKLGQWGNKAYIDFMFDKHWWPDYRNLIDRFGKIPNEPQNVCQIWVLAKI